MLLLNLAQESVRQAPEAAGWVEYAHWSPDGARILLGVADFGADLASAEGGLSTQRSVDPPPSWRPTVASVADQAQRRHLWIYDVVADSLKRLEPIFNVWEAVWCGTSQVVALGSVQAGESAWYDAHIEIIEAASARSQVLYRPAAQVGLLACSPSGHSVAFVEGLASDRGLIAGDMRLIDKKSGGIETVDTGGVDISYVEWRSDRKLLWAGQRGLESVVGTHEPGLRKTVSLWSSVEVVPGGRLPRVCGIGTDGDCVLIAESFLGAPSVSVIENRQLRHVRSLDIGFGAIVEGLATVEPVYWRAPDGLAIEGWFLRPNDTDPRPTIMQVHGGPVWFWRPAWLGRGSALTSLMLLRRGYALFCPNPRGSSGRGQDFARRVLGDTGGADAHDLLTGLDYLAGRKLADPQRLGITGASYGGYMTSWLVTQDQRFSAAVSVAPTTNYVTQHLLSNIPHFDSAFVRGSYQQLGTQYYGRSPIYFASRVATPVLNICGALDRTTPPAEAAQFHRALQESGVKSELVTYPEEGHGIRKWPASFDYSARVVDWFEAHLKGNR